MTIKILCRLRLYLLFASLVLIAIMYQSPALAQQNCGLFGPFCLSNQVCDFVGECRNVPGQINQVCGLGVPCASGLSCSATVGGRCERPGQSTDSCTGLVSFRPVGVNTE